MKKIAVAVALMITPGLVLAGGMELTSARLYKKQGEWLKSLQFYHQAIAKDPGDLDAYFERGELYYDIAKDSTKADLAAQVVPGAADPQAELCDRMLADFREAQTVRGPKDEGTVRKLRKKIDGIVQERWNHYYFEAVQCDSAHTRAMAQGLTSPDPRDYLRQGLGHLDMAIKIIPQKWNSYGLKAQMLGKLEERERALENWSQALAHIEASDMAKREPEDYQQAVMVIRGNLLQDNYNLGRDVETVKIADEILQADSSSVDAVQFKAFAMARMASDTARVAVERDSLKSAAIAALERARSARPDDPIILYYIGQFHLQLGDTASALRSFGDYLKLDDKDREVLFVMGVLYLEGGSFINTAKARDTFARIVELHPDHAPSWINYGIALIRLGDNAKGKEAIEKGKALGGN